MPCHARCLPINLVLGLREINDRFVNGEIEFLCSLYK